MCYEELLKLLPCSSFLRPSVSSHLYSWILAIEAVLEGGGREWHLSRADCPKVDAATWDHTHCCTAFLRYSFVPLQSLCDARNKQLISFVVMSCSSGSGQNNVDSADARKSPCWDSSGPTAKRCRCHHRVGPTGAAAFYVLIFYLIILYHTMLCEFYDIIWYFMSL